jgi:hypothetical protein
MGSSSVWASNSFQMSSRWVEQSGATGAASRCDRRRSGCVGMHARHAAAAMEQQQLLSSFTHSVGPVLVAAHPVVGV